MRYRCLSMIPNNTVDVPEVPLESEYPVLLKVRKRDFELRIPELFLIVRDPSLEHAYAKLVEQRRTFIRLARSFGIENQ